MSVVQIAACGRGGGGFSFASPPTAGNGLVMVSGQRSGNFGPPSFDGTGWTHAATLFTGENGLDVWTKVSTGTEQSVASSFGNQTIAAIFEIVGVPAVRALGTNTGTAAHPNATVAGVLAGDLVIGLFCQGHGGAYDTAAGTITFAPDAGWTEVVDGYASGGGHPNTWLGYQVAPADGSYNPGVTSSIAPDFGPGTFTWGGIAIALEGTPVVPTPGPIVDVYDPDDVYLATIPAKDVRIRPELNDVGSGAFKINRYADEATAAILAKDNYVRVTIPQIHASPIFGFYLDEGDFTLVSSDEHGGEDLAFAGHGQMAAWTRAIWLAESFLVPWWPAYLDTGDPLDPGPPDPADIGAIAFSAGTYQRAFVSGSTVTSWASWHTEASTYYYDLRRKYTYVVDGETRETWLVRLSSGSRAGYFVRPYGTGTALYVKKSSYAFGKSVLMESIDDGDKPGQVLFAMWEEANAADRPIHPLAGYAVDFDDATDSNGDPWSTTDALRAVSAELGDDYLSTIAKLVGTGVLDVEMTVDRVQHAYNAPLGVDRSSTSFAAGKVRLAKGVNIADEVVRELSDTARGTFAEALGPNEGDVGRATIAGSPPREISVRGDSSDPAALAAIGEAELERRLLHSDAIVLNVAVPMIGAEDELAGLYLPGPSWSARGNYWPGDYVTLHTGTGEQDFNEATLRVAAVTIWFDSAGALRAAVDLAAMIGGLPDTSGSAGSGSTGMTGGSGGSGGALPAGELFQLREERDQVDGYPSLDELGRVDFRALETSWKRSVRLASSVNVAIGTILVPGGSLDGETLADGDEVLLLGQTAPEENGVYVVPDAGSAARRGDLRFGADFVGAVVLVREGSSEGIPYRSTATSEPVVDTDAIEWVSLGATISATGGFVPTFLEDGTTFAIPDNRQALFALPIVLGVGSGVTIGTNAALVEVD